MQANETEMNKLICKLAPEENLRISQKAQNFRLIVEDGKWKWEHRKELQRVQYTLKTDDAL